MRRPVRPFVIEFKSRSSKLSTPRAPRIDDANKVDATPAFLDVGVFASGRNSRGDDYETAMKAADAVFGRNDSAALAPEPIASSDAPTGRVLPSLIENIDAATTPSTETEEKPRRNPVTRKTKTASPIPPKSPVRSDSPVRFKKPTIRPQHVAPQDVAKAAAAKPQPDASIAAEPDHERRSLKKRRRLDAELKAGERWKRRLCKAAR